jgi:hypothetical protein
MNPPDQCTQGFYEAQRGAGHALTSYCRGDLALSQPIWLSKERLWRFRIYTVGTVESVGTLEVSPRGKVVFMTTRETLEKNIMRAWRVEIEK